jgi:hypothetical protein
MNTNPVYRVLPHYGKTFTMWWLRDGRRRTPMSKASESRIPVSIDRREQLKAFKRGGENYDTLLAKMAEQYDPEKAE